MKFSRISLFEQEREERHIMTNKCDENNPIVVLGIPCNYTSCIGSYKKGKRIE
jgi:hypothetical protein